MRRAPALGTALLALLVAGPAGPAAPARAADPPKPALRTVAELSGWRKTGRYEEVIRLCDAFQAAYPGRVRCTRFGTTPERRPMLALSASNDGALEPAPALERHRPVVLFQGGIHAGEIDGKDAGFWVLRELLEGQQLRGILSKLTVVFVPVFNVDGHERFGPNNRPNQRGPEEMGWRTTAQNLNLNRDYAKAEAPEMAAMLKLLGAWDPALYIDLHVTDGSDFEHDVAVLVEPSEAGPEPLKSAARKLRDEIQERLTAQHHLPLGFYPSLEKEDDPSSGFSVGVAPPRLSTPYWALHDRFGMLVETHSYKPYAARVRATHDALLAALDIAARDGAAWGQVFESTDEGTKRLAGTDVPLLYDHTEHFTLIDFRGWAYKREPSAISGRMRVVYDERRPEVWKIPLYDELHPVLQVRAPLGGYLVPAAWAAIIEPKLEAHGIERTPIEAPIDGAEVEVFRASEVKRAKESYEGRSTVAVKGAWTKERRAIGAGALFVPIAQKRARLVMHLLEPTAPDSFLSWGFMNAIFERKEYMEAYVAEQVAETMLEKDAAARAEFGKRLDSDKEFAHDPEQRLEFFYRRHPAWDTQINQYPVLRVDRPPKGAAR
jgi:hypothetical protein